MRRRRFSASMADDDPLTLVPNIFDLAIVLAVAFLLVGLGPAKIRDAVQGSDEWVVIRKSKDGRSEVLTHTEGSMKLQRIEPKQAAGKGVRLGSAYQLDDGQVIYVPE